MYALPFTQINPHNESRPNADMLLEQRMHERQTGVAPPATPQGSIPSHFLQIQIPPGMESNLNAHPADVAYFVKLTPTALELYRQQNPKQFYTIISTIQRQYKSAVPAVPAVSVPVPVPVPQTQVEPLQTQPQPRKKKQRPKKKPSVSSEEEIEPVHLSAQTKPHPVRSQPAIPQTAIPTFLSLDYRSNLVDVEGQRYILTFPTQRNVRSIELQSCMVSRTSSLDSEPYIYLHIDEIEGVHANGAFGKLLQERTINDFIAYTPENCSKTFSNPCDFDTFTISFVDYNNEPIVLNKLQIKQIQRTDAELKVVCRTPHNLCYGDAVTITSCTHNSTIADVVYVQSVPRTDTVVLNLPLTELQQGSNLHFEKVCVKCTLTFKITKEIE